MVSFETLFIFLCMQLAPQGPIVQSWISANPGLKLNLLFLFVYFYTSICFETLEKKTPTDPDLDPDDVSEEIFPNL
jgi:hypothetical protein